ncbi:MAG: ribosome maturation factor RimP [Myxococcales bacterium]|jgi:ribosome maturation factor RimP
MVSKAQQLERLRALVEPVCAAHGLSLVDARFVTQRGAVLQVLIERPGLPDGQSGVTLSDCQTISRELSAMLDESSDEASDDTPRVVPAGAYRLEVSSPGVERPLVSKQDFERFAGREIKLHSVKPIDGQRRFQGTLEGLSAASDSGDNATSAAARTCVRLSVPQGKGDAPREVLIPYEDVVKAHLVFRF